MIYGDRTGQPLHRPFTTWGVIGSALPMASGRSTKGTPQGPSGPLMMARGLSIVSAGLVIENRDSRSWCHA